DAPWGWAPYHYGRWVDLDGSWGWTPGPVVAPAVYAPALVGFVGPVGVSVNVGIGVPSVGWVALGFGEPVLPWWGPVGFIGRPFWGGWHGPRVVNNVVINNTRIVNATTINRFQNMSVRNAVIARRRASSRPLVRARARPTLSVTGRWSLRGRPRTRLGGCKRRGCLRRRRP